MRRLATSGIILMAMLAHAASTQTAHAQTATPRTAGAQWQRAADYGSITDGAISFTIDGKAYVGGGPGRKDFWRYDPGTGAWKRLADLGGGNHAWSYTFVIDGKGYMVGGDKTGSFNVVDDVWQYDPTVDTWTRKSAFPGGPRDGGFGFALNGKGYIGGGFNGTSVIGDVWEYDPTSDTWSAIDDYPDGPVVFPAWFVLNGKAYIGTGASTSEFTSLYEFDPTTRGWKARADFPGNPRQTAVGVAMNGKGYFGLGMAGYTVTYQDFWSYDPTADAWTQVEGMDFPDERSGWSSAFLLGDTLYAGLGASFANGGLSFSKSIYKLPTAIATAAVPDAPPAAAIGLSPNPTSGIAWLTRTLDHASEVKVTLLSPLGIEIPVSPLARREPGVLRVPIDTRALPCGTYHLVVTVDGSRRAEPLVVVR